MGVNTKAVRQSNFEWLRIVAILMILCFHYALKGGWSFETGTMERFVQKLFLILGELGVNLFMLITGYFMINGKRRWSQVVLIILQSVFYTFIISLIRSGMGDYSLISFERLLRILFPEVFDTYWYVTVYLLIYIFSPYINIALHSMKQSQFKEMLGIALLLWCIVPSVFQFHFGTSETGFYYSRFIWLMIIYCIGAYIRLYGTGKLNTSAKSIGVGGIVFVLMFLFIYMTEQHPVRFKNIIEQTPYFWPPNTILMTALSVVLFNAFRLWEAKFVPLVNTVAGTTLGIYMLHDGGLTRLVWSTMRKYIHTEGYYVIDILCGVIVVFVITAAVDLCRKGIEQRWLKPYIEKFFEGKDRFEI